VEPLRIQRLRRRASAGAPALLLRLLIGLALLALYAASAGSRPRALRVEVASRAHVLRAVPAADLRDVPGAPGTPAER
jgi:hypothetical protein